MSVKRWFCCKVIFPVIELLPQSLRNKIKLVGTCCFGDGWDYIHSAAFNQDFKDITEQDVKNLYREFSEKSLKILLDYLRYNHLTSALWQYRSTPEDFAIIAPVKQFFPDFPEKIKWELKMSRKARGKYKFKNLAPEVGCYHHGLKLLNDQVHEYIKGKVFLDLGAFIGDSAFVFSKYAPGKILAFEPSVENCRLCKENLAAEGIDCVEIIQAGISDVPGKLFLSENGSATVLGNEGKYEVDCVSVDDFYQRKNYGTIGVIKADLEGMGLKMVKGAIETIKHDRPVLLLSIYHSRDEFLGIYDFLKQNISNYHYQVEALSAWWETSLIAYPDEVCG